MNTVEKKLGNFIDRYNMWKTYKTYNNDCNSYVDFCKFLQLPCYDYYEVDNINSCNGNTIVINNGVESIHSLKYFRQYDKNKHYIIFSAGSWDPNEHDIGITSYNIIFTCFWLFELADSYLSPNRFCYQLDTQYSFQYPKPNIFCCPIGMVRPERDAFVNSVIDNINYDNFILRYSNEDFGVPSDHLDVINFSKGNFDGYSTIIEEYFYSPAQSLPIKIFNSSYCNIIVETDLDWQNCFNVSEKTVKVLISGMPFVILATPYFLKKLQEYGFRTYNTLWDESYDNETNYTNRINKITQLINELEKFDWQKNKQELTAIANHNLRNFTSLNPMLDEMFYSLENIVRQHNERRC